MTFTIIKKNHAADSKIGPSRKINFRAVETHESHRTAWELKISISSSVFKNKGVTSSDIISFVWFYNYLKPQTRRTFPVLEALNLSKRPLVQGKYYSLSHYSGPSGSDAIYRI